MSIVTWGYAEGPPTIVAYCEELELQGQPIEVYHLCEIGGEKIMVSVVMKRHDRRPSLRIVVKDKDTGDPFDFTDVTSAKFLMVDEDGTLVVDSAAAIESPVTAGILRYDWNSGDTDTEGEYRAEFELTYSGGEKLTVPNASDIIVRIYADLNNV
jgi:hypothetical protein